MMYGFFDPATKGMVPQLVEKEKLAKTNSIIATLRILAGLVAPLVSVLLYTKLGVTALFLINGISFLISATSEMMIKYNFNKKSKGINILAVFHDMKEGAVFIKDNSMIYKLSLYFLLVFMFIQPIFGVILPPLFRTKLNYSDTQYGYLQMILLLGALIGSILVGILSKDKKLKGLMLFGIFTMVISVFAFTSLTFKNIIERLGSGSSLYFVLLASVLFLLYTSIMFINIPVQTMIQKVTQKDICLECFL